MSYCLLDAARMEEVLEEAKARIGDNPYVCLYQGISEETLNHVAPYLFTTEPPAFAEWLFAEGWGQSWGVFALSRETMDVLYRHFRRFLLVRTEAGQNLYFRFYDPRVLRRFLPTCASDQLIDFFGPIRYFLVEDEDPQYGLSFWLQDGNLKSQRLSRSEAERAYLSYLQTL